MYRVHCSYKDSQAFSNVYAYAKNVKDHVISLEILDLVRDQDAISSIVYVSGNVVCVSMVFLNAVFVYRLFGFICGNFYGFMKDRRLIHFIKQD